MTTEHPIDHVFGPDADGDFWRRNPGNPQAWQYSPEKGPWIDARNGAIASYLVPLLAPLAKPTPTLTDADGNLWEWRCAIDHLLPRFVRFVPACTINETNTFYPVLVALYQAQHHGRNPWEDA